MSTLKPWTSNTDPSDGPPAKGGAAPGGRKTEGSCRRRRSPGVALHHGGTAPSTRAATDDRRPRDERVGRGHVHRVAQVGQRGDRHPADRVGRAGDVRRHQLVAEDRLAPVAVARARRRRRRPRPAPTSRSSRRGRCTPPSPAPPGTAGSSSPPRTAARASARSCRCRGRGPSRAGSRRTAGRWPPSTPGRPSRTA